MPFSETLRSTSPVIVHGTPQNSASQLLPRNAFLPTCHSSLSKWQEQALTYQVTQRLALPVSTIGQECYFTTPIQCLSDKPQAKGVSAVVWGHIITPRRDRSLPRLQWMLCVSTQSIGDDVSLLCLHLFKTYSPAFFGYDHPVIRYKRRH